jgi:hypothetical protein
MQSQNAWIARSARVRRRGARNKQKATPLPSFLEFLIVDLEVDVMRTKDDRYIWRWRICVVAREDQVYFTTPE